MSRRPREFKVIDGQVCYRCTGACGLWLPESAYYRANPATGSACGRLSRCPKCTTLVARVYRRRAAKRRAAA